MVVEVRSKQGAPLKGFRFEDCTPVVQNTWRSPHSDATCRVEWKRRKRMASLAGRQIRLAFKMRAAHLFAFKARREARK